MPRVAFYFMLRFIFLKKITIRYRGDSVRFMSGEKGQSQAEYVPGSAGSPRRSRSCKRYANVDRVDPGGLTRAAWADTDAADCATLIWPVA
jgi:hypothetical protein